MEASDTECLFRRCAREMDLWLSCPLVETAKAQRTAQPGKPLDASTEICRLRAKRKTAKMIVRIRS